MTYKLVVLRQASGEADAIYEWIAERSQDGAIRWFQAFRDVLRTIEEFPESCPLAPENEVVPQEIREVGFGTRKGRRYRAVFTIVGSEVHVLHVRGPGQRPLNKDELAEEADE